MMRKPSNVLWVKPDLIAWSTCAAVFGYVLKVLINCDLYIFVVVVGGGRELGGVRRHGRGVPCDT